jgi:hypothetical protein
LLPTDAVPWVPELFFVECGAVLHRWDLNRILTRAQIDQAIDALMSWPLRVTQLRGLFADAWGCAPTSFLLMRSTWRQPFTLAPICFPMTADWPTPLAFRSGCCASQAEAGYRHPLQHMAFRAALTPGRLNRVASPRGVGASLTAR